MATCKHASTSLVDMDSKGGPFLTVQCDMCGAVLPYAEIDDATIAAWNTAVLRVPRMDYPAYCSEVDRAWRDVLAADGVVELETFAKVARG